MKKLYSVFLFTFCGISSIFAQTVDETFFKPIPYKSAKIEVIKELPDNKILLGGDITLYQNESVNNLIRLNSDYSLDETFQFEGDSKFKIKDVQLQSNGNIIVLTYLDNFNVPDFFKLYQLGPNGEILKEDNSLFNPKSIAVQTDDKILITGGAPGFYSFTSCYLKRYNSDFSLDETFNNDLAFNDLTQTVKISANGIYVGGVFSAVDAIAKNSLVKIDFNGEVDETFDIGEGTKGREFAITIQNDGKLLIGSNLFIAAANECVPYMVRLNPDGTLDNSFAAIYGSNPQSSIIVNDSHIYLQTILENNLPEFNYYVARLNLDGSFDETFTPAKLNGDTYGFKMAFAGNKIVYSETERTTNNYGLSAIDLDGNLLDSYNLKVGRFGSFDAGEYFNGKLVIKGDFIRINDVETFGIALMDGEGNLDKSFVFPRYLGNINQFQVIDDNTIFVSTTKKLLKMNKKGEIIKNIPFKEKSRLLKIEKFKVFENGEILATDGWMLQKLDEEGNEQLNYTIELEKSFWFSGLSFDMQDEKIIFRAYVNKTDATSLLYKIIRFNLDGTIDDTFQINGSGPDTSVAKSKVLDTGEIIVAGDFLNFNGLSVPNQIVKLSKDGVMDLTFHENQKGGKIGISTNHNFRKIEQLENVLYVTEGNSEVTAINLDGTFVQNFTLPIEADQINDIVAVDDETMPNTSKFKATSPSDEDSFIYAIGTAKKTDNSSPSFIVKLNVGKSSGTLSVGPNPEKLASSVQIYPVPVDKNINLAFTNSVVPSKISIYSVNGTELYSAKMQHVAEAAIDMSAFAPGTYFIKLYTQSGVLSKKIIKK